MKRCPFRTGDCVTIPTTLVWVVPSYFSKTHQASYGFEELDTYTDSNSLFEGLWEEWLNLNVFLLASEMQLADVLYDDLFNNLPKKKQSELIGRKDDFAKKVGITS